MWASVREGSKFDSVPATEETWVRQDRQNLEIIGAVAVRLIVIALVLKFFHLLCTVKKH